MDLTILCVSRFGPHAEPFLHHFDELTRELDATFILGADGDAPQWVADTTATVIQLRSRGYIESVLDEAVAACPDGYVLRVDDDEKISPRLAAWLTARDYRAADHWAFPRMHLWPDDQHHILNDPLWPDLQTRLSVKAKSGGRGRIHVGSPFGTGRVADAPIEHHKFLVRDRAERCRLVQHYENLQPGAGDQFAPFSLPELYTDRIQVAAL